MKQPKYYIEHLCIYDTKPRETMWNFLKWAHSIPQYYWGEDVLISEDDNVASDYTFLACGSKFSVQLEAPMPRLQFKYERDWFDTHPRGINHVCYLVDNALDSYNQLKAAGCEFAQHYTEFPPYNGFVAKDFEDVWIEIMEYKMPETFKVPYMEPRYHSFEKLRMFGPVILCRDLGAQEKFYQDVMGFKSAFRNVTDNQGVIYMIDTRYNVDDNNIAIQLKTPTIAPEKALFEKYGPYISTIAYLSGDVEFAYQRALRAEFESISAPAVDELSGAETAWLREPNGNLIEIREEWKPGQ
ncbi:MAG: VOC family protein [Desulfosarcina sp.]|jgi:catechol 2,3-dioxygenase-like lactoylglutathione lyase family enzyme